MVLPGKYDEVLGHGLVVSCATERESVQGLPNDVDHDVEHLGAGIDNLSQGAFHDLRCCQVNVRER